MTIWEPKTLSQALSTGYEWPGKQRRGLDGTSYYGCGCGRVVRALDMTDVRGVNLPPVTGAAGAAITDADFVCDGCTSSLMRSGKMPSKAWMAKLGCPVNITDKY